MMSVTDIGEATDEAVVCSAATVPEPTTPTDDAPPVRVRQPRLAPVRLRNVYVAALPIGFTDIHLAELLGQFGKLTSCRMFNDSRRVESVGRAYGFGLFERADDAQKAVSGLSGLLVDGHRIQVRLSDTHVVKKTKATRKAALGLVAGCDQGLQDDDNAPACHAPLTKVVEAFVDDIFLTRRPADVVTASERRNWNPSPRQQSQVSSHPSGNRYPSPLPASASSSSSSPQGFNTSPYMASSAPHVVLQAQHPGQGSTMDLFAASTMPPTTFAGMTARPPPGAPPPHHHMMLPPPPNAASHFVALPTTPHLNVMPPLASGYTTSSSTQAPLQQQHHHYAHMHHHHQHLPPPHQQQAVVPFHPPPLPFHQQLQPSQHHHHHHYHHHQQHHHHYFYAAHPSPPPPPHPY